MEKEFCKDPHREMPDKDSQRETKPPYKDSQSNSPIEACPKGDPRLGIPKGESPYTDYQRDMHFYGVRKGNPLVRIGPSTIGDLGIGSHLG